MKNRTEYILFKFTSLYFFFPFFHFAFVFVFVFLNLETNGTSPTSQMFSRDPLKFSVTTNLILNHKCNSADTTQQNKPFPKESRFNFFKKNKVETHQFKQLTKYKKSGLKFSKSDFKIMNSRNPTFRKFPNPNFNQNPYVLKLEFR